MKEGLLGIWKKIRIVLLVILILGIGLFSYIMVGHYSDGYRGGSLIKISNKGIMFKTVEGQLNVGTFLDNGVNKQMSPIWDFSVKKEKGLIEKLDHAILTNKRVKLHYNEMFVRLPWRGEHLFIVDEVELID